MYDRVDGGDTAFVGIARAKHDLEAMKMLENRHPKATPMISL